jgi:biotin carboxyl carrier protein
VDATVRTFVATVNGRSRKVTVVGGGRCRVTVDDGTFEVDARRPTVGLVSLLIDGVSHLADVTATDDGWLVDVAGATYVVAIEDHARHVIRARGGTSASASGQIIKAPMPGKVTHVAVAPGDRVERGDTVVVIEAMKMQNEFKATVAGTVAEIRVQPGQAINAGDVLVLITAASGA